MSPEITRNSIFVHSINKWVTAEPTTHLKYINDRLHQRWQAFYILPNSEPEDIQIAYAWFPVDTAL
jgi:hypothetical protein